MMLFPVQGQNPPLLSLLRSIRPNVLFTTTTQIPKYPLPLHFLRVSVLSEMQQLAALCDSVVIGYVCWLDLLSFSLTFNQLLPHPTKLVCGEEKYIRSLTLHIWGTGGREKFQGRGRDLLAYGKPSNTHILTMRMDGGETPCAHDMGGETKREMDWRKHNTFLLFLNTLLFSLLYMHKLLIPLFFPFLSMTSFAALPVRSCVPYNVALRA